MRIAALLLAGLSIFGGELRFSMRSDPKTLEPLAITDQNSATVRQLTAARLLRRNRATQKLEPELAEKWEVREKGRLLVFRLRPGLQYADGTPADSQDVRVTLERLLDPVKAYPMSEGLRTAGITGVETPGPLEVRIRTAQPVAGLENYFDEIPILSSRSPLKDRAALGPFVLAEYKRGHSLRFVRNPRYFRKDAAGRPLPRLDAVRIDIQGNPELERNRFERRELHLLASLDPESFAALEKTGQAIDAGPTLDSEVMWFNQAGKAPLAEAKRKWFRTREFRRAVSAAIRREDLVRVVFASRAIPGVGPIAPSSKEWFAPGLRAQPYDLKAAEAELRRAGFRKQNGRLQDAAGNAVTFSLLTNSNNRQRMRMASMIQQDLDKLGITVSVVGLDMPSLLERMTRTMNYDAILLGMTSVDLEPNQQMNIWLSSSASHPWNPSQAKPETAWEAEIDKVLETQLHAAAPEKRRQLLRRFQEIVRDEAPMLYLVHPNALGAVSNAVTGVRMSSLQPRMIWNIEEIDVPDRAGVASR